MKLLSRVWLFATPWTVAHYASPSMGFSRQEYWNGLPFPSPVHKSEKWKSHSRVWLFATPWTAAHQAPPSMGFSRQEYWSGVPLHSPTVYYKLVLILKASPHLQFSSVSLLTVYTRKLDIILKQWVSEVAQSCLTLCDPVDCSPPGSSIHGILQAKVL